MVWFRIKDASNSIRVNFRSPLLYVSSGCSYESEFIGRINVGAKPEERESRRERKKKTRKRKRTRRMDRLQISMGVHAYICI